MAHLMDYLVDMVRASQVKLGQATNAVATATLAAVAGSHNVIVKVDASYTTSTTSGLLTIKFGTTEVARKFVHGAGAIDFGIFGFENPDANELISAALAAGGVGEVGEVVMACYTTGPRSTD